MKECSQLLEQEPSRAPGSLEPPMLFIGLSLTGFGTKGFSQQRWPKWYWDEHVIG